MKFVLILVLILGIVGFISVLYILTNMEGTALYDLVKLKFFLYLLN